MACENTRRPSLPREWMADFFKSTALGHKLRKKTGEAHTHFYFIQYVDSGFQAENYIQLKVEKDFIKADSANLPKVDSFMIANFFASNPDFCSAEFRNVKTSVFRSYFRAAMCGWRAALRRKRPPTAGSPPDCVSHSPSRSRSGHMPLCTCRAARSTDVYCVHGGGRTTTTKVDTEIDTTALECC
ncbi:hypothetical protein EVAR_8751_1 [Eumeta japonica]|uniref:Uncharacterized protein n=1 Tax=Eumeta variegata TaxID=151549 RepID=A0A4C1TTR3_EUMVA|nr:hypothetical protein EVAR_8751_1 [Eumeta japonica]